jgi:CheY-like chemotaxis protein
MSAKGCKLDHQFEATRGILLPRQVTIILFLYHPFCDIFFKNRYILNAAQTYKRSAHVYWSAPYFLHSADDLFGGTNYMLDIVKWLAKQEFAACKLYYEASKLFKDDLELSQFLTNLSNDEAEHYHAMAIGLALLKSARPPILSTISLDDHTKSECETPILEIAAKVDSGVITKEALLESIAAIEFRELNGFFLYAVSVLAEKAPEFRSFASTIERHKKRIERFLESLDNSSVCLDKIRQLPKIGKPKILIVEDFEPLREVMPALFCDTGIVQTAGNGHEGLIKMGKEYYDLIISEVTMPIMDGLEFYEQAEMIFGPLPKRFLFYMGQPSNETLGFLDEHKLRYLIKPADIKDIKRTVHEMLLNKSPENNA